MRKRMKLPNNFGSIVKLPGRRRKPWAARKKIDEKYRYLGYFDTYEAALTFLVEYNKDPSVYAPSLVTFAEIYQQEITERSKKIAPVTVRSYRTAFNNCTALHSRKFLSLKVTDLQGVINALSERGIGQPAQKKVRQLFHNIYSYAVKYQLIPQTADISHFVDVDKYKPKYIKTPFNTRQLNRVKALAETSDPLALWATAVLMMCYAGTRPSEFLRIKKSDVKLKSRVFTIGQSKTAAGTNRLIPISLKTMPYFEKWMERPGATLITDDEGNSLRSRNTMSQHYDPSMTIDFKSEFLNESFSEYANEYNRLVAQKGAKLYFEFSPMNELGVENADLEPLSNFYWLLRESFDFPVIGNPEEYVIDPHYFFDSNFHLNDAGAIYRTKIFADDIYRDVFEISKESSIDFPEKPDYPDIIIGEDSESIKYFDLVENSSGYTLSKVKDEYLSIESIDIPMYFNGKVINTIAKGCFELCSNLSEISIPLTISGIENGGFSNKFHLDKVVLLQNDPNKIKVDFTGGLVEGVVDGFKFFVPESGRDAYSVDYYWGPYYSYMEFYDDDLA